MYQLACTIRRMMQKDNKIQNHRNRIARTNTTKARALYQISSRSPDFRLPMYRTSRKKQNNTTCTPMVGLAQTAYVAAASRRRGAATPLATAIQKIYAQQCKCRQRDMMLAVAFQPHFNLTRTAAHSQPQRPRQHLLPPSKNGLSDETRPPPDPKIQITYTYTTQCQSVNALASPQPALSQQQNRILYRFPPALPARHTSPSLNR